MALTLEAWNYRGLRRTVWSPSGVCVLVGPNGAAKTTLLTLFEFLREAYVRGIVPALAASGGAWGLRHLDAPAEEPLLLALTVGDVRWELQLSVLGASVDERVGERVTQGKEVLLSRASFSNRVDYRGQSLPADERLALRMAYDRTTDDALRPLVTALNNLEVYRSYNLGGLRLHGSRQGAEVHLSSNGDNAFTILRTWRDRREHQPRYEFVVRSLRAAFPEVCQDIDFDISGLTVSVGMVLPGQRTAVPAAFAPNGWLTGLLHLCAVASALPGSLIAIEEVENALHPFAIRQLLAAFREWAEENDLTVCLASHSPVLLDEFRDDLGRVFVMEPGHTERPLPLTRLRNPEWLLQFSLGRLYSHGEFGSQRQQPATAPGG